MISGRELDALVATNVMGFIKQFTSCSDLCNQGFLRPRDSGALEMVGCVHAIPHYSIDISVAWEVVDKINEKRFEFILGFSQISQRWTANFYSSKDNIGNGYTASHAICLASLKAVGVDINE